MKKIEVFLFLFILLIILSYIGMVYSQTSSSGVSITILAADTAPPNITITKAGPTSARVIALNGTYLEDNAIANITIEMNSSYIVKATINDASKTWNASVNLTEGWNKFYVLAYDEFGNFANVTSSSQGASILSDTTKPTINLTTPKNSTSVANNSLISFSIKDLFLADAFYTINSGATKSFNSIYEIRVGTSEWVDGMNYIIVNATDIINNVEKKNFTFSYINKYEVILNASINTAQNEIISANSTATNLQDASALQTIINDMPAEISVNEYNKTLQALNVVANLTSAVSAIETLLQDILNANASGGDNATKTAAINAKLEQIITIKNTTIKSVEVNLFNPNLTVAVASTTISNVTNVLAAAVSGLSAADKAAFEQESEALQNKTTIINKIQTLTQTFLNGRTSNITLFEKNITINETQPGEFYINEFIDKNITGDNDLNADTDVSNRISQAMTVVAADPIVRWSSSDTGGASVSYTIDRNVPSTKNTESKTVVTTVPSAGGGGGQQAEGAAGGGGGGGAGGTAPAKKADFTVDKSSLKVVLKQGETKEEAITIKNTGDAALDMTTYFQALKEFVFSPSLDEMKITLSPNEEQTLNIVFGAGENLKPDIYTGEIKIKSGILEKIISTIIEVESAKPLFDVDVEVLPQYKSIFPGEDVFIEVSLFNVRGFGRVDVNIEYAIKDFKGNAIAMEEETLAVENQAKFTRELLIPSDIKPGTYIASVKVTFENSVGTSSDLFEVKARSIRLLPIKNYMVYLLLGAAFLIFTGSVFLMYEFGVIKKRVPKTKEEEFKGMQSEEKAQKLQKELEALEQAYKSKFISEESYMKSRERIENELKKFSKQ